MECIIGIVLSGAYPMNRIFGRREMDPKKEPRNPCFQMGILPIAVSSPTCAIAFKRKKK